ncbi:MAG: phosphoribosylglycinamide formyltransferase [Flavobacteriales bacterium Tduv]
MRVAVLVSGKGSNLQRIFQAIEQGELSDLCVSHVIADRDCTVLEHGLDRDVPTFSLERSPYLSKEIDEILTGEADLIVLAGFLSILEGYFCRKWHEKLINIHPSLLPQYGGEGMYGMRVHRAVLKNREKVSGATTHYVIPEVDSGEIILQKSCSISSDESPESLAKKVRSVEHEILIETIRKLSADFLASRI